MVADYRIAVSPAPTFRVTNGTQGPLPMTPVLVFDIETIPDIAGLRTLHELPAALPDAEVAEFAFQRQRARNGSDFLPLHLQRVVVISCALRNNEGFRVWSLAEPKSGEGEIIQRFFDGVENSRRRSCPGTAAASTCRCCTIAA
jgi:predicted PolB exonuclease-like 3'-5' exonuclease